MKWIEWEKEVKRVAKALNLSEEQSLELYTWSVNMAFDQLDKAQTKFMDREACEKYVADNTVVVDLRNKENDQ